MSDLRPQDELSPRMHPAVRNYGPDTEYDWDQSIWYRWVAESRAEQLGMSVDAARTMIKENGGMSQWAKPRDINYPLSRIVADGDS